MKSPLIQRMENLEQIISGITNRLEELNHLLAQPDTYGNGTDTAALNREYNELKKSLEEHNRHRIGNVGGILLARENDRKLTVFKN